MTTWQSLKHFDKYEINTEYPYDIRRKGKTNVLKGRYNHEGYKRVKLNGKEYLFHRLVANQFIENNDETKTQIDHIDRNRSNNNINNLRWCTRSENCLNRSGGRCYKFDEVDKLPDDAFEFCEYNGHEFEDYYYAPSVDTFYFFNGVKYRKLPRCLKKNMLCVHVRTNKNIYVQVFFSKFKKIYNII